VAYTFICEPGDTLKICLPARNDCDKAEPASWRPAVSMPQVQPGTGARENPGAGTPGPTNAFDAGSGTAEATASKLRSSAPYSRLVVKRADLMWPTFDSEMAPPKPIRYTLLDCTEGMSLSDRRP